MPRAGSKSRQYTISVRVNDTVCNQWFSAQHNKSLSIRKLIYDHVEECGGYVDALFGQMRPQEGAPEVASLMEERADAPAPEPSPEEAAPDSEVPHIAQEAPEAVTDDAARAQASQLPPQEGPAVDDDLQAKLNRMMGVVH